MADWMDEWVEAYQSENQRVWDSYDRLKELDLVILDNSVRESTVGQLKSHTADDKFKIFEEAAKCGFKVWVWPIHRYHRALRTKKFQSYTIQSYILQTPGLQEKIVGSFNGMTRVDDQFVKDMVEHTINNAETEEAQEIIKGFWGFVEVTYALPKGTDSRASVNRRVMEGRVYSLFTL